MTAGDAGCVSASPSILIRDAAYRAIAKAVRDLHERIAEWIGVRTRDIAGEYEEILGWH